MPGSRLSSSGVRASSVFWPLRACSHFSPSLHLLWEEAVEYCICTGVGETVLSMSAPVDEILVTSCQREAFDFLVRKLKG